MPWNIRDDCWLKLFIWFSNGSCSFFFFFFFCLMIFPFSTSSFLLVTTTCRLLDPPLRCYVPELNVFLFFWRHSFRRLELIGCCWKLLLKKFATHSRKRRRRRRRKHIEYNNQGFLSISLSPFPVSFAILQIFLLRETETEQLVIYLRRNNLTGKCFINAEGKLLIGWNRH